MKDKMLLLIVGSSGAGKNTVINQILKNNKDVKFVVSHTSRTLREGESEGVNYHYVTKQNFEKKIENKEMLEYDITHEVYYGISRQTIKESFKDCAILIKDLSLLGTYNCKDILSQDMEVCSIFLTNTKRELKNRLIKRGEKDIALRLKIYEKEQSQMNRCDYIIFNSDLNLTTEMVKTIINNFKKKQYLLPLKNLKINEKKVDKFERLLKSGRILKPVKVAYDGKNLHLLNGSEQYLASLKCSQTLAKQVIFKKVKSVIDKDNKNSFNKLIKSYTDKK